MTNLSDFFSKFSENDKIFLLARHCSILASMDSNQQIKLLESVTNYFGLTYDEDKNKPDENNNYQLSREKNIGQNLRTGQNFQKSTLSLNSKNQAGFGKWEVPPPPEVPPSIPPLTILLLFYY